MAQYLEASPFTQLKRRPTNRHPRDALHTTILSTQRTNNTTRYLTHTNHNQHHKGNHRHIVLPVQLVLAPRGPARRSTYVFGVEAAALKLDFFLMM